MRPEKQLKLAVQQSTLASLEETVQSIGKYCRQAFLNDIIVNIATRRLVDGSIGVVAGLPLRPVIKEVVENPI